MTNLESQVGEREISQETEIRQSVDDLSKLQLQIYAKEMAKLYREVRELRQRLAKYELPGGSEASYVGRPSSELSPSGPGVYEGNVRLNVQVAGGIRLVISFVHQLQDVSTLRVTRLEKGPGDSVILWVALREPLYLPSLLNPNPPKDTDGRREDSGRGWVRELQGRWPGVLG